MLNPVNFADLLSFLFIVAVLAILWRGRSKQFMSQDAMWLLAAIVGLVLFHSFSNVLEWSKINNALDPIEDFVQVLVPIMWGYFFYVFLRTGTEQTLRESEARYYSLFEYSPISLWEEDASDLKQWMDRLRRSGTSDFRRYFEEHPEAVEACVKIIRILDANRATLKLFGTQNKAELFGGLGDVFTQESMATFKEELIALSEGQMWFESEGIVRNLRGEKLSVVLSMCVAPGYEDTWSKVFVSIIDRTQQVLAESQRDTVEERFRSIIQHLSDIVWVTDENMVVQYETPSCSRILGYPPDYMVGKVGTGFVHSDDLGEVTIELGKVFRKENDFTPTGFRLRHADGHWVNLEAVANSVLDHNGIRGIIVTARDVTERKKAEERYYQAQKMEAVGLLAGGIAHDFNNLLTAITGFSELAQSQLETREHAHELIGKALEASSQAAELVEQLLAFSRKQIIEPKVLDLNSTIYKLEKMLRRIIGEHIALDTELSPGLWHVKADPSQIEQVLVNLVVNARDAMPEGGRLTIETTNVTQEESYTTNYLKIKPGEYVQLNVSDTGAGMSDEVKAHLFEPFFTTKGVGKGTGLGLATVYHIIQQSGGHIWVYSEEGKGSVFKIYLPKAQEPFAPTPQPGKSRQSSPGTEMILVVEDDPFVRQVILTILSSLGYTVLEAANAEQALRLAEEHRDRIALMLTDVIIPGKNSRELAAEISGICPKLKTLFMSGYTDNTIVHQGVLDPGIPFIRKPFAQRELAEKIRELLDENPNTPLSFSPKI